MCLCSVGYDYGYTFTDCMSINIIFYYPDAPKYDIRHDYCVKHR